MMYSCFRLVSIFLILHASFVCTSEIDASVDIKSLNLSAADASTPGTVQSRLGSATNNELTILASVTREDLLAMHAQQLQTTSEQRCDEYAKEIESETGISCFDMVPILKRIGCDPVINGIEAEVNKFPHMVALGKYILDREFILICGGALISHTWVLSAAHCSHRSNVRPSHARIGISELTNENAGITIGIKKIILHPEYKPPMMYADVALVELKNAVTFSASIRPACLFQDDEESATIWNSGWNAWNADLGAGKQSDPILKAELALIDNSECTNVYNNARELPYGIRSSMLCANDSHSQWNRGTCLGQTGSPLQTTDPIYNCLYQVVGITSLGLNCAIINTPGVYTKVSYYVPWIEKIIWQE